ncbi:MAG: AAA family ATPase [Lachnospiraceae bacterium]|nr:AAA family ATPase [Lachnospiraceae bacterium]
MSSILQKTNMNKIFLIYGHLDDMFITGDLQKVNFRPFLNGYLKNLGYEQIVYYSGAKNVGKFVLDDESAVLAINKNKGYVLPDKNKKAESEVQDTASSQNGSTADTQGSVAGAQSASYAAQNAGATITDAPKKRRITRPNAKPMVKPASESGAQSLSESAAQSLSNSGILYSSESGAQPSSGGAQSIAGSMAEAPKTNDMSAVQASQSASAPNAETKKDDPNKGRKLIYRQPKITPVEFLDDAKNMMAGTKHKSAIVFTFIQDFVTDKSAPMQPYLELVSHLWDEYSSGNNENICIFLAPQMSCSDLRRMFDNMENGSVLRNRFFNNDGTVNRSTAMEVGLPNNDELGFMLDYLRIVGDGGKRLSFRQDEKKRITSSIMYLSREAERDENRSGYLHAIYNNITSYMKAQTEDKVELNDDIVKKLYSKYRKIDESDPLEKLKKTEGWESVADRIDEILRDCRMKRAAYEKNALKPAVESKKLGCSNERIDVDDSNAGFKYSVPHFILRGNPGVGKTTVARLIGQILYNEGILQKGTTIEAKRDDLVGQYIGETAIKTNECVESAIEGVLFIDDAYSLYEKGDDHNYAKEAIDTLVPIMTNPEKYRLCIIMAGYPEPMDELLEMNAGLRSRFSKANILTIDDYKPELLQKIFVNDCKKDGYRFIGEQEGETPLDLELFFNNLYNQRNRADFGNARDIVALSKEVKMQSSLRDDVARIITAEDFGDSGKYFIKRGVSSIDEIYAQIDKYVGMGFVKDLFKNIRLEVLDTIESKKRGIKPEPYPDHYIFAGNPGTGKTTVGKMIGEFYHMMEVLGGAETKFVDASDIIGNHVGDSKDKIVEIMQDAIDHNQVLYIDEAYQISESAYGNEIIGAMMTKMTENADDFKVIFGMYSNRVEAFLKMNAGLSRRLRVVEFPDYNPEQLLEIFDRTISSQGCTITEEAHHRIKLILTHKYNVRGEDFGNAGEVKKMVIDMKRLRLERVYASDIEGDARYEYIVDDIPKELLDMVADKVNPKTLDDIMKELNEQIGMSDLKNIIVQKQEELIFARKMGESPDDIRPGYYFFVGNPGTGKSTSAKLFAQCLQQMGIVKTENFYSCTAKDLVGQYVGQTQGKAYELLKKSRNAVLFIDEAYSLSYADNAGSGNDFKKEALEEIIAFMDDPEHRRTCCIILAGYEKDMQGLYRSNSGMRSRIEEVHFRDYSAEETYDIFALFCKKGGFKIADGVKEMYIPIFEVLKTNEYFSNGRTARTIYEKTIANTKRRIVRSDNIDPAEAKTILPEDVLTSEEAVRVIGVDSV